MGLNEKVLNNLRMYGVRDLIHDRDGSTHYVEWQGVPQVSDISLKILKGTAKG